MRCNDHDNMTKKCARVRGCAFNVHKQQCIAAIVYGGRVQETGNTGFGFAYDVWLLFIPSHHRIVLDPIALVVFEPEQHQDEQGHRDVDVKEQRWV